MRAMAAAADEGARRLLSEDGCRQLEGLSVGTWIGLSMTIGLLVGGALGSALTLRLTRRKNELLGDAVLKRLLSAVPNRVQQLRSSSGVPIMAVAADPYASFAPLAKHKNQHQPPLPPKTTRSVAAAALNREDSPSPHHDGVEGWALRAESRLTFPADDGRGKQSGREEGGNQKEMAAAASNATGETELREVTCIGGATELSCVGIGKLERQYELEDLEPEWRGILSLIDQMLVDENQGTLMPDERPVVMCSLLKSSPSEGVESALRKAVSRVRSYRFETNKNVGNGVSEP